MWRDVSVAFAKVWEVCYTVSQTRGQACLASAGDHATAQSLLALGGCFLWGYCQRMACGQTDKRMMADIESIGQLKPDPKNARKHNPRNIGMIEKALGEVGAARSIVIDEEGTILAGNGVVEAAAQAGIERVQVVDADGETIVAVRRKGLTQEQKTKLALFDNRTAELAEWDTEVLADIADDIPLDDLFNPDELRDLGVGLTEPAEDPGAQIDRAEELQEKWQVQRGQVWEISKHRLMCGDSTSAEDVARLMGDVRAGLMNTDPPYGVGYANDERPHPGVAKPRVAKPRVAKDEFHDEELQRFLEGAFGAAVSCALLPNAAWYLWHAHLTQGFFAAAAAAAAADVILHRQIIWVKPVLLLGRGQYHWKHEPCFMGWVRGHEPPDYGLGNGERVQTTIWEIQPISAAERRAFNHSTPKPVGLFTIPIIKHLRAGEVCYDPFEGTGPQFVAAEQTGRICYGMEIEPKYCAVTLERLAGMGLEPRLVTP